MSEQSAQPHKDRGLFLTLDVLAKLGVLAGGLFAAWQFWEAKADQRVARTTAYIERYEEGRVGEARRRINAELRNYLTQFQEISAAGISSADRDEMLLSLAEANGGALGADFDVVADFFQGVEICTREGLCNSAVAERYFAASDAPDLWLNFEPYVRLRRENNPRFAEGMEALAGIQSTPNTPNEAQ